MICCNYILEVVVANLYIMLILHVGGICAFILKWVFYSEGRCVLFTVCALCSIIR